MNKSQLFHYLRGEHKGVKIFVAHAAVQAVDGKGEGYPHGEHHLEIGYLVGIPVYFSANAGNISCLGGFDIDAE